uniref:Uncharacterized protein n=1 Tax=Pristionchus pacificus TaxID=54126 RepID=A0A2A6CHF1_PRIPA|eukprot:PDM77451.1 hypothetical protein PRIPAC_33181 [Pristionchus pacificus]
MERTEPVAIRPAGAKPESSTGATPNCCSCDPTPNLTAGVPADCCCTMHEGGKIPRDEKEAVQDQML